jgi:hypothetical protein
MKKIPFLFWFITSFFLIPFLWGVSISDFDGIVDFSITLEEMSEALETNDFSRINKDKFVILNGIASAIRPEKQYFFLLNPEDIKNVPAFINKLKNAKDKVSRFLIDQFPPEIQEEIKAYKDSSGQEKDLIKNITNELKKLFRKMNIYEKERFKGIPVGGELVDVAQRNLEIEEMAFVNRLLIEAAYPSEINKVIVQIEVVYGVWIGYDEVKSYRSIIEFKGPECFKIFKRIRTKNASREMIPVNSTVLIVAKIIEPLSLQDSGKGWRLEGFYIREVQ